MNFGAFCSNNQTFTLTNFLMEDKQSVVPGYGRQEIKLIQHILFTIPVATKIIKDRVLTPKNNSLS